MYDFGKYKMTPSSRIQRPSAVTEEILPEVIYKFSTLLPPGLDRTILERSSNISRRIIDPMRWTGGGGGLPSYILKSQ